MGHEMTTRLTGGYDPQRFLLPDLMLEASYPQKKAVSIASVLESRPCFDLQYYSNTGSRSRPGRSLGSVRKVVMGHGERVSRRINLTHWSYAGAKGDQWQTQ
jgi:hypothetical protein